MDILAELRGPNAKVIARNHKHVLSGYEGTIRLEVVLNPDRRFELLFVRQDEFYVPFGFDASIRGCGTRCRRAGQSRFCYDDAAFHVRLSSDFLTFEYAEIGTHNFRESQDGHSEREFEEVVFSELKFGKPPASAFVLPVSVPDGTEVLLNERPRSRRSGETVKSSKSIGERLRNISLAEMASKWPLWIYLLAAMAVIAVGVFRFGGFPLVDHVWRPAAISYLVRIALPNSRVFRVLHLRSRDLRWMSR